MISNALVYEECPTGFNATVEVAGIYVTVHQHILLMQRSPHKSEPGRWGVPAGKLEAGEPPLIAAQRELFEETGIRPVSGTSLALLGTLFIRKPELDYVYHLFGIRLDAIPMLCLCDEHSTYTWVSREKAETLPLMQGAKHALDLYYQKVDGFV